MRMFGAGHQFEDRLGASWLTENFAQLEVEQRRATNMRKVFAVIIAILALIFALVYHGHSKS
jgi:hypothetical protein